MSKTPKGISIEGADKSGTRVNLWITQQTPNAQVCEVCLTDPTSHRSKGRVRLVDEYIVPQPTPGTDTIEVRGVTPDYFRVGANIPATVYHPQPKL